MSDGSKPGSVSTPTFIVPPCHHCDSGCMLLVIRRPVQRRLRPILHDSVRRKSHASSGHLFQTRFLVASLSRRSSRCSMRQLTEDQQDLLPLRLRTQVTSPFPSGEQLLPLLLRRFLGRLEITA